MFDKEIDKRSRRAMTDYLKKHFRYNTLNSWNASTSYANSIKLHEVDKPVDMDEVTWCQMYQVAEWQESLRDILDDFGQSHQWRWQAGINGRSGGYLVLYQGGTKSGGYQSFCTQCGQRNCQIVTENQKGICGRCRQRARVNFDKPPEDIFTWPGKSVDMHEDFSDWSLVDLRDRVELVQDFDRLCGDILLAYIDYCNRYRIADQEILVPKTLQVLVPVNEWRQ